MSATTPRPARESGRRQRQQVVRNGQPGHGSTLAAGPSHDIRCGHGWRAGQPQAAARVEQVALARVPGQRRGALELRARLVAARPSLCEQVAADARQQVVALRAPARRAARRRAPGRPPGRTPSPTATARLSSTTGDGASCGERVVERGDPRPVGLRRRARPRVAGGDRGLQRVRAERRRPAPRARSSAASPRPDQQPVPARAVLVEQQHRLARRADRAPRAATPGSPSARPARAPRARPASARRGCGRAAARPRTAPGASSRRRRSPRSPR